MTTNIEFTDRYGGRSPSWLRSCHGQCEAMGVYPVMARQPDNVDELSAHRLTDLTDAENAQIYAAIARGDRQADGWYFLRCPDCGGSGRVSWQETARRIPAWLHRGVRSFREFSPRSAVWHGHPFGTLRRAWVAFKVSFLCDLGVRP